MKSRKRSVNEYRSRRIFFDRIVTKNQCTHTRSKGFRKSISQGRGVFLLATVPILPVDVGCVGAVCFRTTACHAKMWRATPAAPKTSATKCGESRGGFGPRATRAVALGLAQIPSYTPLWIFMAQSILPWNGPSSQRPSSKGYLGSSRPTALLTYSSLLRLPEWPVRQS
jgi:hypothetical protein